LAIFAGDLPRESGSPIRRKPEEIYDNTFVNNLEKSGFLKEIWAAKIINGKKIKANNKAPVRKGLLALSYQLHKFFISLRL